MDIFVPIKQVPETSNVKMDPVTGTMIRTDTEAIINPLDLYAIETALRIKEKHGGRVITLTMGPPKAEKALREAVAMGCDDGILLTDKQFAGADTWATAYTLAHAIHELGTFDLIICGERATDGDTGQVGPGIASFLDLPLATYVRKIYDINETGYRVERLVEGGTEVYRMTYPSVITVVKEIAAPRLPTLRGMHKAKARVFPVWGPNEIKANMDWLGLKGSPTRVVKIDRPVVSRQGEVLIAREPAAIQQAVERLAEFLHKKHLF